MRIENGMNSLGSVGNLMSPVVQKRVKHPCFGGPRILTPFFAFSSVFGGHTLLTRYLEDYRETPPNPRIPQLQLQDIFASAFVGPDVVHLSGDMQMQVMPVVGYKEKSP